MNIHQLIAQELDNAVEPDPHVMVESIVPTLTPEQRDEVLYPGVLGLLLQGIRASRSNSNGNGSTGGKKGRSRRKRAFDELMQRFPVGDGWKFLGDCGVDDLLLIAADYTRRSDQEAAIAEKFSLEAEELRASGYGTVRAWREAQ